MEYERVLNNNLLFHNANTILFFSHSIDFPDTSAIPPRVKGDTYKGVIK